MEKERVILGENCCYSSDCNETGLNNNIKDQKAVILKLDMYDEIYETQILEDSDSISAPVFDCFAITRNNNGYGVVDIISGEQVIPNSYEKIEDRIIEDDGNWIRVKFICKNSKGEYEIIEKQF